MLLLRRKLLSLSTMVKIGTHDGAFHADEVLACVMLKLLPRYQDAEIVRTRDPSALSACDLVVDVGGEFDPSRHRYDHHQRGFDHSVSTLVPGKRWTTKLSSAGLVYVHFGREIVGAVLGADKDGDLVDKIFDKVYANFLEEVDAHDNGIPSHDGEPRFQVTTDLGSRVAALRPAWNDENQDFDAGFHRAMDLVRPEFVDRVGYYGRVWWPARSIVAEAVEGRFQVHPSGRVIAFQEGRSCPYKEHLFELEEEKGLTSPDDQILFAVFTDSKGTWRVMSVPAQGRQFESRLCLPEPWRALRDDRLSEAAGVDGCIFVHAAGFIGGNRTREGALQMAAKALEMGRRAAQNGE